MGVTISPCRWVIRWGATHERYGDAYEGVGTLIKLGSEGWIEGMAGRQFTKSIRQKIQQFCAAHGMPLVRWERFKNGAPSMEKWQMSVCKLTLVAGDPATSGFEADLIYAGNTPEQDAALLAAIQKAIAGFGPEVVPIKLDFTGSDGTVTSLLSTEGTWSDVGKLEDDIFPALRALGTP